MAGRMTSWADVVAAVVDVAERAGDVARVCRADAALLRWLVVEKAVDAAHPRHGTTAPDLKSIADVLIQQMVVDALAKIDAGLGTRVRGEEETSFATARRREGGSETHVEISVGPTPAATRARLELVAGADHAAACEALARAAHGLDRGYVDNEDAAQRALLAGVPADVDALACWVDPIDGTNEYVRDNVDGAAAVDTAASPGLVRGGLHVACVLIGLYDRHTGAPVLGVVHQPFHRRLPDGTWRGRTLWGGRRIAGHCIRPQRPPGSPSASASASAHTRVLVSSAEAPAVIARLRAAGLEPTAVAGCGYKLLAVLDGLAAAYVLTQPTAYCWDTCAIDALLHAAGGAVVDAVTGSPLTYARAAADNADAQAAVARHATGVIAAGDASTLATILASLHGHADSAALP